MSFPNSPLEHYIFSDAGKLVDVDAHNWLVLLAIGKDLRKDTFIAEIAESFPGEHPLDLIFRERHKDELIWHS